MIFSVCIRENEVFTKHASWETELKRMREKGVNIIFPYINDFDFPVEKLCALAKAAGIEVYPWIKPAFAVQNPYLRCMENDDLKLQKELFTTEIRRPCMNDNRNTDAGLDNIQKFIEKYKNHLKGLMLDYVRNDNALFLKRFPCQCAVCQEARKPWLGHGVLTAGDMANPAVIYKELELRNQSTTAFVQSVRKMTNDAGLKLTMAARANYVNQPDIEEPPVFGLGPSVYEGQDWHAWAKQGLFDFICTMNYHTDTKMYRDVVREHQRLLAGTGADFHSGIGLSSSMGHASPELVKKLANIAKENGATGCMIFHWGGVDDSYDAFGADI
jgi:uncharacterized lipoprotein YddW (UPF0748 family)